MLICSNCTYATSSLVLETFYSGRMLCSLSSFISSLAYIDIHVVAGELNREYTKYLVMSLYTVEIQFGLTWHFILSYQSNPELDI